MIKRCRVVNDEKSGVRRVGGRPWASFFECDPLLFITESDGLRIRGARVFRDIFCAIHEIVRHGSLDSLGS